MKKILISALVTSFLILGCQDSVITVNPEIGETFKIKYGESLVFQDEQISVRFDELAEDSRCPDDVACVWAGNARIIIQLNDLEADLNTYSDPKEANISQYNVKLLSLSPYPKAEENINKEDYTAELLVTMN
ncbi:MAG TPA: hypothetical protein VFM80_03360 [Gracilimonas sp.]|uniref:hypothetical protein n=1 Tax=Gracilimonas sp. TaxID=1974203 RepID=UPI002D9DF62C|nr:hypothetical protein [Gracilimonas sp.]